MNSIPERQNQSNGQLLLQYYRKMKKPLLAAGEKWNAL
jgi:hypothetical protein